MTDENNTSNPQPKTNQLFSYVNTYRQMIEKITMYDKKVETKGF